MKFIAILFLAASASAGILTNPLASGGPLSYYQMYQIVSAVYSSPVGSLMPPMTQTLNSAIALNSVASTIQESTSQIQNLLTTTIAKIEKDFAAGLAMPTLPAGFPTLPSLPAMPTLPSALKVTIPPLPSLPPMPTIPALPASLPSLPPMPTIPALPASLPSLPPMPTIPALPASLPSLPPMPTFPALPASLPSLPPMPTLPALPASLPPMPTIPSLASLIQTTTAKPASYLSSITSYFG